jgi:hypothetical protein
MPPVYAQSSGSFLIITPNSFSVSDFSLITRRFPVYQSSTAQMIVDTNIVLPADYILEEKPEDLSLSAGPFQISRTYTLSGGTLNSHTVVKSTLGAISPADYPAIKAKLDAAAAQSQKPLVLRRKNAVKS